MIHFFNAVIWSGDNWGTKTRLGTLKSDNSGKSLVRALSADGKIAMGISDTDSGVSRVFISRISRSVPAPVEAPQPAPIAP
uniref:hypothetical protein n=1 Tax=Candidatus Regiella insecticola TaxID=138073 RepID=UPI001C3FC3A5